MWVVRLLINEMPVMAFRDRKSALRFIEKGENGEFVCRWEPRFSPKNVSIVPKARPIWD